MKNVLVLGATSDMALALSRKFASDGFSITLAARNAERLMPMQADLKIRYNVPVHIAKFDATALNDHLPFYQNLPVRPDIVICVFGLLGDQLKAEKDWKACEEILYSNYIGAVSILNVVANDMETRKEGVIVGISSVAGERGRQSNYLYGSAKAGFTTYLSGLRNRLFKSGVHVLTVKPGFVRTRMIENLKTPDALTAKPAQVASDIYDAVMKGKNVIYTKSIWRPVMYVIKTIPESIFKKLKL